jgi:hypothetical protein
MDARTAYETFLRKRVSDTHWSSVKRTLIDSGMEVNPDTVVFFAKLRKEIPRASVGIFRYLSVTSKLRSYWLSIPQRLRVHRFWRFLMERESTPIQQRFRAGLSHWEDSDKHAFTIPKSSPVYSLQLSFTRLQIPPN